MEKLNKVIAGLTECDRGRERNCEECPYWEFVDYTCVQALRRDALTVIEALRAERDDLRKDIEVLLERRSSGDLIRREDALNALKGIIDRTGLDGVAIEVILGVIDSVDAEPVVHARWEMKSNGYKLALECSHCGNREEFGGDYCRECGAHMDKEVSDGR